ncbi:hypothetical protein EWM64_g1232 [Hericium alpestre]|uniref:Uncharacterized protein n=1 Tax=Hericium alpestre TaxID=135208 RepID=A0A4Z0A8Y6_9AGAM|nr:hypothetical protein EWM64_g1232 [Hericium alpestre]
MPTFTDLLVLEPYIGTARLDFDANLGLIFRFEDSYDVRIEDSGSGVLWVGHGTALDSGVLGPFDADRFLQDWLQQGPGKEELAAMQSAYLDAGLDKGMYNLYSEEEEEERESAKAEEEEEDAYDNEG